MNAVTTNSSLSLSFSSSLPSPPSPSLLWNRVIGLSRERRNCVALPPPPPPVEEDLLEVYDGFGI